jgi:hypothetical protein
MMLSNLVKTEEELAVYKAICRLPMRLDELALIMKKEPMQLMVEHELDLVQVNMMSVWTTSELRRHKMQHISGYRTEEVAEFFDLER